MANIILIQALAELAYSIAMADGELQEDEKDTFFKIIDEELGEYSWTAKNRFNLLQEHVSPNIEQTYKFALFAIKTNKRDFNDDMRQKFISVIEKVATSVEGMREKEIKIIERFKKDVQHVGV